MFCERSRIHVPEENRDVASDGDVTALAVITAPSVTPSKTGGVGPAERGPSKTGGVGPAERGKSESRSIKPATILSGPLASAIHRFSTRENSILGTARPSRRRQSCAWKLSGED